MGAPDPVWTDAGHGVRYWVWDEHGNLYYTHDCPLLKDNPSAIALDVPQNAHVPADGKWQVESLDPVTLSPSLLCPCGHHGFIRNGRWEPA
jgi:hypothetical protein